VCAHPVDYGIVVLGLLGVLFSLVFVYFGVLLLRRALMMRRLPLTSIHQIKEGVVKVYGTVAAASGTLLSPFTNKTCVYYKCLIEERRSDTDSSPIKSVSNMVCFYLDDGTGRVLINPDCALIDLSTDYKFYSGVYKDPPEKLLNFLSENNIRPDGWFGLKKGMKFFEYCIEPGKKLYVIGTARKNPGGQHEYDSKNGFVIGAAKGNLFYITDKPGKKVFFKAVASALGSFAIGVFLLLICAFVLANGLGII
jgi:hypothetical protein